MKKLNIRGAAVKISVGLVITLMVGMAVIVVLAIKTSLPAILGTRTNPVSTASGGNVPKVDEKLFDKVTEILENKDPALEIIDQNSIEAGKQNLGKDDPFAP